MARDIMLLSEARVLLGHELLRFGCEYRRLIKIDKRTVERARSGLAPCPIERIEGDLQHFAERYISSVCGFIKSLKGIGCRSDANMLIAPRSESALLPALSRRFPAWKTVLLSDTVNRRFFHGLLFLWGLCGEGRWSFVHGGEVIDAFVHAAPAMSVGSLFSSSLSPPSSVFSRVMTSCMNA